MLEILGNYTFFDCRLLSTVLLPFTTKQIGNFAFSQTNLSKITIHPSIASLGVSCFAGTSIASIDLSASALSSLPPQTFLNARNLRSVLLPDSLTEIGDFCFRDCTSLASVSIPSHLFAIGRECFTRTGVSFFISPSSLLHFGESIFSCCARLTSADLTLFAPTDIPASLFEGCSSLTSLKLPAHGFTIGERCFFGSGLTSAVLPKWAAMLHESAFAGSRALARADLSTLNITDIPKGCFANCRALRSIAFPALLTSLGPNAFEGTAIEEFFAPPSLQSIGEGCFWSCQQLRIVSLVKANVSRIPEYAFADCKRLAELYIPASVRVIDADALRKSNISKLVYLGLRGIPTRGHIFFPLVLVPRRYSDDVFLGNPVKKNITKYSVIPGLPTELGPPYEALSGAGAIVLFIAFLIWRKMKKRPIGFEGEDESLLPHRVEVASNGFPVDAPRHLLAT
jgi:hypothetical protein